MIETIILACIVTTHGNGAVCTRYHDKDWLTTEDCIVWLDAHIASKDEPVVPYAWYCKYAELEVQ